MSQVTYSAALFADNATESNVIDVSDKVLCAIHIPAGFVGTTITFTASTSPEGTFLPVHDASDALYTATCAASQVAVVSPDATRGLKYVKLVAASQTGGPLELQCALVQNDAS